MSDDLEKRLRERFWGANTVAEAWQFRWADMLEAARIGAEIEREECFQIAEDHADAVHPGEDARSVAISILETIRARGDK